MPIAPTTTFTRSNNLQARYPQDVRTIAVRLPPGVTYAAGQVLAEAANVATRNEVQTLTVTGTPTGGTLAVTVPNRGTTTPLAHNSTAAQVQAALEALIGAGNVACTGGPLPGTAVVITFTGEYGNRDVQLLTVAASLTGGTTPAAAIAETTRGSAGPTESMIAVIDANSDGTQIPKGVLMQSVTTDEKGCVVNEWGLNGNATTVPMAIAGEFPVNQLVGLLAAHVTEGNAKKLGKLTSGNAITDAGAIIKIGV
jgi:hypothetical protein